MKFVTEQQAKRLIRQRIGTSNKSRLAVAFWGDGACKKLDLVGREDTVSVICNLRMGGTNPHEIQRLQSLGIPVSQCDGLHAKVYLFDDGVLIGSSNASSNGLSFQDDEGPSWIEANVFSDDPDLIASVSKWMSKLPTREITPPDIAFAIVQWERRRQAIAGTGIEGKSVVATMRRSPSAFDGQRIFVCFYSTEMDEEGEKGLAAAQKEFGDKGDKIDGFQDWPELPKRGILICFWVGSRGGISSDGCYRRQENPPDRILPHSTLQLLWEVSDRPDLKVRSTELQDWKEIYKNVRKSELWDVAESCAVVNLSDVARRFLPT
jgi:hypothetical protein